jgi:hypothetical protein
MNSATVAGVMEPEEEFPFYLESVSVASPIRERLWQSGVLLSLNGWIKDTER